MFGIARLLLAMIVVSTHVWTTSSGFLAWQSVFCFYTLSGFLMCLILHGSYGFSCRGFGAFSLNRFLRIYPTWYLAQALAAAYIFFIGPLNQLNRTIVLPDNFRDITASFTLFGQVGIDFGQISLQRLATTSWSLCIELFCYVLLAFGFAKSPRTIGLMLFLGVVSVVGLHEILVDANVHYGPYHFQNHYGVLQAGLIPFSLGGLAFFYRDHRYFSPSSGKFLVLFLLLLGNAAASFHSSFHAHVSSLFLASTLAAVIVPMLFRCQARGASARIDDIAGKLSYPIFISHWIFASIAHNHLGLDRGTFQMFLVTCLFALFFAIVATAMEGRIEYLRRSIKTKIRVAATS